MPLASFDVGRSIRKYQEGPCLQKVEEEKGQTKNQRWQPGPSKLDETRQMRLIVHCVWSFTCSKRAFLALVNTTSTRHHLTHRLQELSLRRHIVHTTLRVWIVQPRDRPFRQNTSFLSSFSSYIKSVPFLERLSTARGIFCSTAATIATTAGIVPPASIGRLPPPSPPNAIPTPLRMKPAPYDIPHKVAHGHKDHRRSDLPEVAITVDDALKVRKVHAKIPRQEAEWQEQNRHQGQLAHRLVLEAADGVEDEVRHRGGRAAHLVEVVGDEDDVVLNVAEVGARHVADLQRGGGGLDRRRAGAGAGAGAAGGDTVAIMGVVVLVVMVVTSSRTLMVAVAATVVALAGLEDGNRLGLVLAQRVDHVGHRLDSVAEGSDLGGDDVEGASVTDGGFCKVRGSIISSRPCS